MKRRIHNPQRARAVATPRFYVTRFKKSFPQRAIVQALNRHVALLPNGLRKSKISIAYTVGKSNFRRDYHRNFHT